MIKFRNLKQSVTGSPQPKLESNFHLIENSENTNSIEMMDHLKESLAPRTFNKISYAAVLIWFVISVIFFGIFAEVENTESRYDFRCGGAIRFTQTLLSFPTGLTTTLLQTDKSNSKFIQGRATKNHIRKAWKTSLMIKIRKY